MRRVSTGTTLSTNTASGTGGGILLSVDGLQGITEVAADINAALVTAGIAR